MKIGENHTFKSMYFNQFLITTKKKIRSLSLKKNQMIHELHQKKIRRERERNLLERTLNQTKNQETHSKINRRERRSCLGIKLIKGHFWNNIKDI